MRKHDKTLDHLYVALRLTNMCKSLPKLRFYERADEEAIFKECWELIYLI